MGNCTKRSKVIFFVSSSVFDAGNFDILLPSIEHLDQHVPIKLEDSGTVLNKGTLSTVFVYVEVDAKNRSPKEQRTVNQNVKVSIKSNFNGVLDPRLKNEQGDWQVHFVC